jgi:speckle-type POZ protein
VLKIDGYSLLKGLGVNPFIGSGKFTVGGRSWQMRYYPDGWDADQCADWISLSLFRVDADGPDVKARYSFSLLDQAQGRGRHVPLNAETLHTYPANTGHGYGKFFQRKSLESAYLRDDSLEIRCDLTVVTEIRATEAVGVTTRFVVAPPSDMHRHFGRLLSSGQGADVTFEVAGGKFAAHRYVLAARSCVFAAELFGPMKEKAAACVAIRDMEARVFQAMLHFIYTDSLPENGDDGEASEMAQHLLVAADRYNLERLKLICEEKLCSNIDTSTVATTLTLAEQHGCRGLKQACFNFLKFGDNLKALVVSDGFDHLASSCPLVLKELVGQLAS